MSSGPTTTVLTTYPAAARNTMSDSQDSVASTTSSGVPRLLSSLSNVSNISSANTLLTSPTQSSAPSSQKKGDDGLELQPPVTRLQPKTPSLDTNVNVLDGQEPPSASTEGQTASHESSLPSPMSVDAPDLPHGVKRTASGLVKVPSTTEPSAKRHQGHSRNISIESSSTTTRSSELAAQLKTRLSYAMVKVQHGWAHESLDQLEERTSQMGSPVTGRFEGVLRYSDSPQYSSSHRRRMSTYSENSDQYLTSPGDFGAFRGISRSLNATPSYHKAFTQRAADDAASFRGDPVQQAALMALAAPGGTYDHHRDQHHRHGLAPAADITSRRSRRSHTTNVPPSLAAMHNGSKSHSDLGPRAPVTPRQGILRMPSGEADREAIDALLFLASPNTSVNTTRRRQPALQTSSLRGDLGVKRVAFGPEHQETT